MAKVKGKSAVVEELDDDLELIGEDDEAPAKSSKKGSKSKASADKPAPKAEKAESTGYGASWLAEYVNEELDTDYTAAQMRVILRKMANDGEIEREVGTDRARYSFTGENDKIVKAVLKRVRSGEADKAKEERLEAARSGPSGKSQKRKAKDEDTEADEPKATKRRKKSADEDEAEEAPAKPKATRKRSA